MMSKSEMLTTKIVEMNGTKLYYETRGSGASNSLLSRHTPRRFTTVRLGTENHKDTSNPTKRA